MASTELSTDDKQACREILESNCPAVVVMRRLYATALRSGDITAQCTVPADPPAAKLLTKVMQVWVETNDSAYWLHRGFVLLAPYGFTVQKISHSRYMEYIWQRNPQR